MKAWIIWGRSIGFDPHVLLWLLGLLNQQLFMVLSEAQKWPSFEARYHLCLIGRRKARPVHLMRQPFFIHLKRAIHIKDGFTILNDFYSACGEALAITDTIHLKECWRRWVPWPKEVRMEGVRQSIVVDGSNRRDQCLGDNLPTE